MANRLILRLTATARIMPMLSTMRITQMMAEEDPPAEGGPDEGPPGTATTPPAS